MNELVYAYESGQARLERANKRLWIVCLILIAALILTNVAWVIYESQFEIVADETEIHATQEGGGVNIVGGGDVNYGADSTHQENSQEAR